MAYERLVKCPVEELLPKLGTGKLGVAPGIRVKTGSIRLLVFKQSHVCAECGLKGTHFWVERHKYGKQKRWHLNLYATLPDGSERMLTKDHIIPKSKGGTNDLDNLQTLCFECNQRKADSLPGEKPKPKPKPQPIQRSPIRVGSVVEKRSGKKFKNKEYTAVVVGFVKMKVLASNSSKAKGTYKNKTFLILKGLDNPVPRKSCRSII